MSTQKLRRELLRRLPPGYTIEHRGTSHQVLYGPDGEVVRQLDGRPFTVPCSAGDHRNFANLVAKLRETGVPVE